MGKQIIEIGHERDSNRVEIKTKIPGLSVNIFYGKTGLDLYFNGEISINPLATNHIKIISNEELFKGGK